MELYRHILFQVQPIEGNSNNRIVHFMNNLLAVHIHLIIPLAARSVILLTSIDGQIAMLITPYLVEPLFLYRYRGTYNETKHC